MLADPQQIRALPVIGPVSPVDSSRTLLPSAFGVAEQKLNLVEMTLALSKSSSHVENFAIFSKVVCWKLEAMHSGILGLQIGIYPACATVDTNHLVNL